MRFPDPVRQAWEWFDERYFHRIGTTIWEKDWDVCCVLDGCRLDVLREELADVESMWSVASTSQTWISRTFRRRDLRNVGYITGNPYSDRLDADEFGYFHFEKVTTTDDGVETVPPSVLTDRAISVWRNRTDLDALIVHYMQPHVPFRSKSVWFSDYLDSTEWGASRWQAVGERYSKEEWMDAYRDNLTWVLDDGVTRLAENCNGVIGITADHGNAIGEWGWYGHPRGVPIPAIRRVPWTTIQGVDERWRTPEVGDPAEPANLDEQLEALGYK